MGRKIFAIVLILTALIVGLTLLQRRFQPKTEAVVSVTPPSVPTIRGKPVADFSLPNLDGGTVHSTDFNGKVLLVNFWATWCAPCLIEIPWFIDFQKKYGPQGLEVIGISMDETGAKDVTPFAKKHGMTYTVLLGNDKVAEQFGGIRGLPTTFLVDRNGKYYSMHQGLVSNDTVEEELQLLLGKKSANLLTRPKAAGRPERSEDATRGS